MASFVNERLASPRWRRAGDGGGGCRERDGTRSRKRTEKWAASAARRSRANDPIRAKILLHPAPMSRWRWGWMAGLVAMTGCAMFREPAVMAPAPVADLGVPQSDLAHPKTLAWTRRYCAKMATHSASELGLAPSGPIVPRVEKILAEHGIPPELSAVPALESKNDHYARGSQGELGMMRLGQAA